MTENGCDGTGTIAGSVHGRTIRFEKYMPVFTLAVGEETISAVEYLTRELGEGWAQNVPHPPVIYEGEFSEDYSTASGSWLLEFGDAALPCPGSPARRSAPVVDGVADDVSDATMAGAMARRDRVGRMPGHMSPGRDVGSGAVGNPTL